MATTQKRDSETLGYVAKATLRDTRISARKARLVVDLIRGKHVATALDILDCSNKKTAPLVKKLLLSAAASANNEFKVDVDELFVKKVWVDEGKTLKRMMPRAQGRATPIRKRHSHITIVLDEIGAR